MVMEVVHEDMGEGSMHCTNHTHKNSTPGGICGSCLQEKLGKLVSSSSSVPIFPSSSPSSSSSPSFRSDINGTSAFQVQHHHLASSSSSTSQNRGNVSGYGTRRSRLGFVSTNKNKNKKNDGVEMESADPTRIVFNRSKSTRTPRRGMHFLNDEDYSPHRRGFWSFLYLSKHSAAKKDDKHYKDLNFTSATPSTVSSSVGLSSVNGVNSTGVVVVGNGGAIRLREQKREDLVVVEENDSSPDDVQARFDSKVSRSRSVGCGSRSFSGDFFERISTGFGDCTLRRVESQREGKAKVHSIHKNGGINGQVCIKERVKCGGIFSGFAITSSSSSSSSSLNYVSSSEDSNVKGKSVSAAAHSSKGHLPAHVRSKSWGWAFASPMRAFSKPSSVKRDANSKKNATPNLNAIPSLLTASS